MAHSESGALIPDIADWAVICELARLVEASKGRESGGSGVRVPLTADEIVSMMRSRIRELKHPATIPTLSTVE